MRFGPWGKIILPKKWRNEKSSGTFFPEAGGPSYDHLFNPSHFYFLTVWIPDYPISQLGVRKSRPHGTAQSIHPQRAKNPVILGER